MHTKTNTYIYYRHTCTNMCSKQHQQHHTRVLWWISSQVRNSYENGHFNVLNIYIGIYLVFLVGLCLCLSIWVFLCLCVCVCDDYGSPVLPVPIGSYIHGTMVLHLPHLILYLAFAFAVCTVTECCGLCCYCCRFLFSCVSVFLAGSLSLSRTSRSNNKQ